MGKHGNTAESKYKHDENKSLAMLQKIAGHRSYIRTANITIILNIFIDLSFKKKCGVPKVKEEFEVS